MGRSPSYDAARTAAVRIDRSAEGRLRVTGADRVSWLQGLLTNDIAALAPGQGCYTAYLTPQGRMISDLRVLMLADGVLLDVPAASRAAVLERLEQFIISEDVEIEDLTSAVGRLGLHGPAAPDVLATALPRLALGLAEAAPTLSEHAHAGSFAGDGVLVAGSRDLGLPGYDIYCAAARVTHLAAALAACGASDIDAATWDTLRIEAGRPRFGADMDTDTIPLEAGIENRAISLTKGCYVGQEVIIRVLHRGGGRVAKRLVGVAAVAAEPAGTAPVPAPGTPIRRDDRDVGRVTSAAWSPALQRVIALGYVHRDAAASGTALVVASDPPVPVHVADLPFVAVPRAVA